MCFLYSFRVVANILGYSISALQTSQMQLLLCGHLLPRTTSPAGQYGWLTLMSSCGCPLTTMFLAYGHELIYDFIAERINMTPRDQRSKMLVLKILIIPKRFGMPGSVLSMRMDLWVHLRKPLCALSVQEPMLKRDG